MPSLADLWAAIRGRHAGCVAGVLTEVPELAAERAARPRPRFVHARSGDGWPPLHLAAFLGRRSAVDLLLERGAPVAAPSGRSERNQALHAAISGTCDRGIVEQLVSSGADVNAAGAHGIAPLHSAAARGDEEAVRLLPRSRARAEARLDDGRWRPILPRSGGIQPSPRCSAVPLMAVACSPPIREPSDAGREGSRARCGPPGIEAWDPTLATGGVLAAGPRSDLTEFRRCARSRLPALPQNDESLGPDGVRAMKGESLVGVEGNRLTLFPPGVLSDR